MNRDLDASHQARAWTLLLIACGIAWFAVLGARPLFNPDEGRYAQIPAEMLASGDFTVPHLDGLVYLEKPPLQYWATAATLAVFGHNEFGARLFTAASAVLAIVFVYLLGARAYSRERGLFAAGMTASMLLYVFMGQLITLDMALACFLTIAVAGFALAQLERERAPRLTRNWMLLCWAAMAAATLTKGLIGIVIPGAVLVLYTLWQRDFAAWRNLHIGKGLVLLGVLVLPWFVLVERAQPGALNFLIIHEHFQRYLTRVHDRFQPWWYFLMILAAGCLPWLPQVGRALLTGWRRQAPAGAFDVGRVLWLAAAFTLFFFSLSDSKLAPYIVPVLPPLALLAAVEGDTGRTDLGRSALLSVACGLVLGVAILLYGARELAPGRLATFVALRPWTAAIALVLVASGVAVFRLRLSSFGVATRLQAASGFAVALALIAGAATSVSAHYSAKPLLAAAGPLDADAPFFTVDCFDWTLPFYTRRLVTPVAWRGELDFGLKLAPALGVPAIADFKARWQAGTAGYALLPRPLHADLVHAGLGMRVLAQDFDNVLVSRR
jgi:4-amino-4-deoxy-L-arabinose transferase-like glycosyltransferase